MVSCFTGKCGPLSDLLLSIQAVRCRQHPLGGHQNAPAEVESAVGLKRDHEGPVMGRGDGPADNSVPGGRGGGLQEGDWVFWRMVFPKCPCEKTISIDCTDNKVM